MFNLKSWYLAALSFLFVSLPLIAAADEVNTLEEKLDRGLVTCQDNCTFCDLLATGDNIIKFAVQISFILVVGFIVWGALNIMTAGGNESRFKDGRKKITIALSGLLIVLVSWVFIHQLLFVLAGNRLFQGSFADWAWNEIPCEVNTIAPPVSNSGNPSSGPGNAGGGSFANTPSAEICASDSRLAAFYGVTYPFGDSFEITRIRNHVLSELAAAGLSGLVDQSQIYTKENTNPKCNLTRGRAVCGIASCQHKVNSCHYGGTSGSGSLAVDFNAIPGNHESETELYNAILKIANTSGGLAGFGASNVIFESDHTHISAPSCR